MQESLEPVAETKPATKTKAEKTSEPEVTPKTEEPPKDPTAKFIESKSELARYSMSQAFREFVMKNYKRFNEFKTESDYEKAFKEFWGETK